MITQDQYWLAQPPAVRALRNMDTNGSARGALALQLSQHGFTIDAPIMISNWDADEVMAVREADGMTWVPKIGQPNVQSALLLPGETPNPPFVPYDPTSPPPGAIKVSRDPSDYRPFDPPPPAVPPPPTNIVGKVVWGNLYDAGPGAMTGDSRVPAVSDGQEVTQAGVNYIAHVGNILGAPSIAFTKV